MRKYLLTALLLTVLNNWPISNAFAKGMNNGTTVELCGVPSKVAPVGEHVAFDLAGLARVTTCKGGQCSAMVLPFGEAKVELELGSFSPGTTSFFGMGPVSPCSGENAWTGGALKSSAKELVTILNGNVARNAETHFELSAPKLSFNARGQLESIQSKVLRLTDANLK